MNFLKQTTELPTGCIPYTECRAKTCPDGTPGTYVFDHCRYAGYVAEGLVALLPKAVRQLLPPETPFLVSLHDIGKVSPEYEIKYFEIILLRYSSKWVSLLKKRSFYRSHASIGAISLKCQFGLFNDSPLISAVAAHHGSLPPALAMFPKDDLGDIGEWQTERVNLTTALAKEFSVEINQITSLTFPAELLAGITCVADWIASDETFFPPNECALTSNEGRNRAAQALEQCGFKKTEFRSGLPFRDIFGFEPYPAQATFHNTVSTPGVYVLEAPMGMGKTEAALYAAYRLIDKGFHSGLYFALPTRLTSDRIYARVENFLQKVAVEPTAVKLAHGQAWLKEFATGAEGSDRKAGQRPPPWFNPSKRGLLFPFAVGTIDQALLSVLNVKHSFVRSYALAGKVVILDEVHSYDAYTGTLLDTLVARLRELGCTVIILSATLTAARRQALLGTSAMNDTSYPLLTGVRSTGEPVMCKLAPPPSKSVHINWINASSENAITAAVKKARMGCNVLCIANTVATAQEWFRMAKSEMAEKEFKLGLLHAKFTGTDRQNIEDEWMSLLGKDATNRPHGSILVATQIVEQSVDIDADWMLSELAPADMLLQRLGRLWRHERANRPTRVPEMVIVCAQMPTQDLSNLPTKTKELESFFGRGVWVYAPYVLLRTFEIFLARQKINMPDDIRPLLEMVYAQTIPDTALHKTLYDDMQSKAEKLQQFARMGQSDALPTRNDDEKTAGTRYNSRPTISLLLVKSLERTAKGNEFSATLLNGQTVAISPYCRNFAVTRSLYQNIVQVAPNDVLRDEQTENNILSQHFFATEMPHICIWEPLSGALRLYNTGTEIGYCYTTELGAFQLSDKTSGKLHKIFKNDESGFFFDNDNDW